MSVCDCNRRPPQEAGPGASRRPHVSGAERSGPATIGPFQRLQEWHRESPDDGGQGGSDRVISVGCKAKVSTCSSARGVPSRSGICRGKKRDFPRFVSSLHAVWPKGGNGCSFCKIFPKELEETVRDRFVSSTMTAVSNCQSWKSLTGKGLIMGQGFASEPTLGMVAKGQSERVGHDPTVVSVVPWSTPGAGGYSCKPLC